MHHKPLDYDPKTLRPHPLTKLIPPVSKERCAVLAASLSEAGQIDPAILYEGKLLDGNTRAMELAQQGKSIKCIEFDSTWGSPVEFVLAKISGREMSDGQKAWSAAQFAEKLIGGKSSTKKGKSRAVAALRFGLSERHVEDAITLMRHAPAIFNRLAENDRKQALNVNRAMQLYRRETRQREQRKLVKRADIDISDADLREGDVLERMEEIPGNSIDRIFTDSPYDLGVPYHGDATRDKRGEEGFVSWCRQWLAECARVLKPGGSIFVMISGRFAARLEMIQRELGLSWRNAVYWWDSNPENQKGNWSSAVRVISYFVKPGADFVFDESQRVDSRRKLIADKRALPEGMLPHNVWIDIRIPGNSLSRVPFADAPPQLPREIPERVMCTCSNAGDVILDPFNGNGTTAVAALLNGRKYIGIDQNPKYLKQSRQWIAAELARHKKEAA